MQLPTVSCTTTTPTHLAHVQAETFQKKGRQLRNKMWWQYCKMKLVIFGCLILLAVVIFLIACYSGGRNCTSRGGDKKDRSPSPPPPPPPPYVVNPTNPQLNVTDPSLNTTGNGTRHLLYSLLFD